MSATNIMAPEKLREYSGIEEEVLSRVGRLGGNVLATRERDADYSLRVVATYMKVLCCRSCAQPGNTSCRKMEIQVPKWFRENFETRERREKERKK